MVTSFSQKYLLGFNILKAFHIGLISTYRLKSPISTVKRPISSNWRRLRDSLLQSARLIAEPIWSKGVIVRVLSSFIHWLHLALGSLVVHLTLIFLNRTIFLRVHVTNNWAHYWLFPSRAYNVPFEVEYLVVNDFERC